MFYLLCVTLCLAAMFIVTAVVSLALLPLERIVIAMSSHRGPRATANLIFLVRILPFLLGSMAGLGLALPAFLKFEPSHTTEMPGLPLLVVAGFGAMMIVIAVQRCCRIAHTTWAMQNKWLHQSQLVLESKATIPVYRLEDSRSLLAVTGIFHPRIFMSGDVATVLNSAELEAALAHEVSHVKARDNLKQFVLKVIHAPRWLRIWQDLDSAWVNTSELAADEGAIIEGGSALDLSSALIKVGRLSMKSYPPAELAASHLVDGCGAATQARAARLRELLESESSGCRLQAADEPAYAPILFATLLLVYVGLLTFLPVIHEVLEYLVR